MNCNVGNADRIVRALVGIAQVVGWLLGWTEDVLAMALGVIGVVLLAPSAVRLCPLYHLFGANTCHS